MAAARKNHLHGEQALDRELGGLIPSLQYGSAVLENEQLARSTVSRVLTVAAIDPPAYSEILFSDARVFRRTVWSK